MLVVIVIVCATLYAVSGQAAAVLWRVASDCDKAKLELTKAGMVAPAVALLHRANQDAASATQVCLLIRNMQYH